MNKEDQVIGRKASTLSGEKLAQEPAIGDGKIVSSKADDKAALSVRTRSRQKAIEQQQQPSSDDRSQRVPVLAPTPEPNAFDGAVVEAFADVDVSSSITAAGSDAVIAPLISINGIE